MTKVSSIVATIVKINSLFGLCLIVEVLCSKLQIYLKPHP
jgi:hypothetical protein